VLAALFALQLGVAPMAASAETLPANFRDTVVLRGLDRPTVVRFSPDGRVFVAQKNGEILVYVSPAATTPTVFADLRTEVYDYADLGLLGLALDPGFPQRPYIYALFTYDAPIGGTAPVFNDACGDSTGVGCVVSGRLVRLTASGDKAISEQTLISDQWCQQSTTHSIGTVEFGPDGDLYVSAGDGASGAYADYGQAGNPCGDPPSPAGTNLTPPTAQGGALRAQSARRPDGEPAVLNGTVIRVDPGTGAAAAGNPLTGDPDRQRIVAYGLRNPFRFTLRPGTGELWIGDVGWSTWEEVDRAANPTTEVQNFGWPCYEGDAPQSTYQGIGLDSCSTLADSTVTAPYYTYQHSFPLFPGDSCPVTTGSSISGLAFYTGGTYPGSYDGGLFFSDYSRKCVYFMPRGSNGLPDPSRVQSFITAAAGPVDLQIGPGGDLFYAGYDDGAIHRITYAAPPTLTPLPPPPPPRPRLLLGTTRIGSHHFTSPAGRAIAFSLVATGDGALHSLRIYLDGRDRAHRILVGLYEDRRGRPGRSLGRATLHHARPGAWNQLRLSSPTLRARHHYWLVLIAPHATLSVRYTSTRCRALLSRRSHLRALPAAWTAATTRHACGLSASGWGQPISPVVLQRPSP
jgi:glucose/arabinose dehydrogenase